MGERAEDERLTELYNRGFNIYSISRLNTISQCEHQAYLGYILGEKGHGNIWSDIGGLIHDKLEECIHGEAQESELLSTIQDELDNLDVLGIDFPLDKNGNPSIRNNWIANMTKFAEEFKTPKGKFETEQLILYPIDGKNWMQGYIDVIRHNKDDSIDIIDWKTSSKFTGDHLIEAGRQLILYGLAKQREGFKIRKLSWVMLKYCETSWTLKNGNTKTKVSEWRNLIKDMQNPIEKALAELGYDETDIECLMMDGIKQNKWSVFPQEIQDKFKTRIYVQDYEFSQENIDETLQYIKDCINKFQTLKEWKPCDIEKNSFFCASLCSYNDKCKYWEDYCNNFEKKDEDDDLF